MHPFQLSGACAARLQLAAQPILDRLDIMIGARLDLFDGRDVGCFRIFRERHEEFPRGERQLR
jgi:hypothetical protein